MNILGENLKRYRKKEGLTQEDVATYVGKTKNVVSHWEKGVNRPDADTIFLLCQLLKITPNQLFNWNDDIPNDISYVKGKEKEFFDIFNKLNPMFQDYILQTAKDLLETQCKMESTKEETADSLEPTNIQTEVEKAEAEYIKSISNSAKKTKSVASHTIKDENTNGNKAI